MATTRVGELDATIDLINKPFKDNLDDAEKSFAKTGSKFESIAETASMVIGGAFLAAAGAIAGVGIAAFKTSEDLTKSLNDLQAETGATTEEMVELRESVENIYASNFGDDLNDVAKSMADVKNSTSLVGDELENATTAAFILRDTFEFDIASSANTANTLMKQFSITSEDAFDLIARGAQTSANKNGDMLEVLNEYAPQFKALGFSANSFLETLVDGGDAGAFQIDKVGDSIKEFTIRSKDLSDSSADAFSALGLDAETMFKDFGSGGESAAMAFEEVIESMNALEDPLEKNAVGVALFGTQFEDLEAGVLDVLSNIDGSFNDVTGTIDSINDVKYDSFSEGLQGIWRTIQTSVLVPIAESFTPAIQSMSDTLNEKLPAALEQFEVVFASIKNGVTVAVEFITMLVESVKAWVSDNSEEIEEWQQLFANLFESVVNMITGFVQMVQWIWEKYGDDITAVLKATWDHVVNIFKSAITLITDIFNVFGALFRGDWEGLWDALITLFTDFNEIFYSLFDSAFEAIKSFLSLVFKVIADLFAAWWEKVKSSAKESLDFIVAIFFSMWEAAINTVNDIKDAISNTWDDIIEVLSNIDLFEIGKNIMEGLKDGIISIGRSIKDAISEPIESAVDGVKDFLGIQSPSKLFKEIGENVMQGLSIGIEDETDVLDDALKGVENQFDVSGNSMVLDSNSPELANAQQAPEQSFAIIIEPTADGTDTLLESMIDRIRVVNYNSEEVMG